jgi:hypothetical protein
VRTLVEKSSPYSAKKQQKIPENKESYLGNLDIRATMSGSKRA